MTGGDQKTANEDGIRMLWRLARFFWKEYDAVPKLHHDDFPGVIDYLTLFTKLIT